VLDTNDPQVKGQEHFAFDSEYTLTGRSLVLFELQRDEET